MSELPTRSKNAVRNAVPCVLVGMAAGVLVVEGGDTPRDFWAAGISAGIGLVGSLIYAGLESDPQRAARLPSSAWSLLRFFLAFEFTRYGAAKIVGMQFYKRYSQLDSRVIDLEPARLAWSFFGASYGYQAISGAIEIVGAVLLCFRRTATLGACLILTVISNVVLLDFHYGIPVRLTSSTFLAMTLYVLAFDARRFAAFFFGDGPVPPRDYLVKGSGDKRVVAARAVLIAFVLGYPAGDIVHTAFRHRVLTEDALEGAWEVDQAVGLDGLLPTLPRWDKVYFEKGDYGYVRVGKQLYRFTIVVDELRGTLHLAMFGRESQSLEASFQQSEPNKVHIEGMRDGKRVALDLTRIFPRKP